MRAFLLAALCATCATFQPPHKTHAVSSRTTTTVIASLFGNNKQKEAEERARIEAEQEALNAKWAKESQNDLIAMSIFGVGTSLPVIYLLWIALTGEGGGGAGTF